MSRRLLVSVFIAFILIGCDSTPRDDTPRIDTSSNHMVDSSIEKIRESLTDEKKREFEVALDIVLDNQLKISTKGLFTKRVHTNILNYDEKKLLHNKSADDVIAEAKEILNKK